MIIEISDFHSLSIVLYYNNKNEHNVTENLATCHFVYQFSFPHNIDITCIDFSLYCIGEDELNESMFGI